MFEKCSNCSTRLIMGKRDEMGIFCSHICQQFYRYPGFCQNCQSVTKPEGAGSTYTINGIGTTLYGSKDPCPVCGSKIQRKWFCVIYIPLIPIGKYRTLWTSPGRYISRKLKSVKEQEVVSGGPTIHSTMGR
jgi:hypothetical protein